MSHHGITDKLLDEAFVLGNYLRDLPEDLSHDLLYFFGIELLRHSGIAGHVGEKDGDVLAFAVCCCGGG